jgi:hypothetical protein
MQSLQETFDAARMDALKAYGKLEWHLAGLFRLLLNIPLSKANLIFYRIVNTRARYGIIDDLISLSHPDYARFWSRLEQLLQSCDTRRNHLTHWMDVLNVEDETFYLENPVSLLRELPGALKYDVNGLSAFGDECKRLGLIVYHFERHLKSPEATDDLPPALIEIFQRPPENLKLAGFRQALFDAARPAPREPLRV